MRSHPWRNGLWLAVVLVAVGALWVSFAPRRAGGQAAYVIVAGASMEPALHRGDLVIARQTGDYQVGDIVTYQHPVVGPVIHRILASEDGRFTLKGDANEWTDSYEPTVADILGEAWIRVPGAGKLLIQLRKPAMLSLLALGVSALLVMMVVPMKSSSHSARARNLFARALTMIAREASVLQAAVFALGLISLLSLLLVIPAWTHSLYRSAARTLEYTQQGAFSYGARVSAGVYDWGTLETGDPVYLRLNRTLSMKFDYTLTSDAPASVQGTTALKVEVRDVNGWHRTLVLQPPKPFAGATAMAFGVLDLNTVVKYIGDLEALTGVVRPFYTLVVIPEVTLTGELGHQPIRTAFVPALTFQLDSLELQLVREDPAAPGDDPIHPSQEGKLEYQVTEANRIGLLGASMGVRAARWISAIGLLVGLGGLAVLAWLVNRAQRLDPEASASMRFGAQIVDVEAGGFKPKSALRMNKLEDLARVAARAGTMIHRVRGEAGSEYFVQDGERVYRCTGNPSAEGRS
jgi:signal peptidase